MAANLSLQNLIFGPLQMVGTVFLCKSAYINDSNMLVDIAEIK